MTFASTVLVAPVISKASPQALLHHLRLDGERKHCPGLTDQDQHMLTGYILAIADRNAQQHWAKLLLENHALDESDLLRLVRTDTIIRSGPLAVLLLRQAQSNELRWTIMRKNLIVHMSLEHCHLWASGNLDPDEGRTLHALSHAWKDGPDTEFLELCREVLALQFEQREVYLSLLGDDTAQNRSTWRQTAAFLRHQRVRDLVEVARSL